MIPSKTCVLVIDDDVDILAATSQLLDEEGFEAHTCRNGRDALEWLKSHDPPSVILLDVKMPLMDGWTLWQESRYVRGIRDVPVIIITADTRMERMAELTGVAGFLHKPFDIDTLIDRIRAVTEKSPSPTPSPGEAVSSGKASPY